MRLNLTDGSSSAGVGSPWDWTPDGRQLLSRKLIQGVRNQILVYNLTSDGKPDGEPRIFGEGMYARLSPDGHRVAFSSNESGTDEVYVDAFPSPMRRIRLSTAGGNFPVFSPDGREVYYVAPGNKLMAVALKMAGNSVQPDAPKELFVLSASDSPVSPYDIGKDGRFLVRADVPRPSRSLTAIVNWQALIK